MSPCTLLFLASSGSFPSTPPPIVWEIDARTGHTGWNGLSDPNSVKALDFFEQDLIGTSLAGVEFSGMESLSFTYIEGGDEESSGTAVIAWDTSSITGRFDIDVSWDSQFSIEDAYSQMSVTAWARAEPETPVEFTLSYVGNFPAVFKTYYGRITAHGHSNQHGDPGILGAPISGSFSGLVTTTQSTRTFDEYPGVVYSKVSLPYDQAQASASSGFAQVLAHSNQSCILQCPGSLLSGSGYLDYDLELVPVGPEIQVQPTGLVFGDVAWGEVVEQSFTVSNVGESLTMLEGYASVIYAFTDTSSPFEIEGADASGRVQFALAGGESEDFVVRFLPLKEHSIALAETQLGESLVGLVGIDHNDLDTPYAASDVALTGRPDYPELINFGEANCLQGKNPTGQPRPGFLFVEYEWESSTGKLSDLGHQSQDHKKRSKIQEVLTAQSPLAGQKYPPPFQEKLVPKSPEPLFMWLPTETLVAPNIGGGYDHHGPLATFPKDTVKACPPWQIGSFTLLQEFRWRAPWLPSGYIKLGPTRKIIRGVRPATLGSGWEYFVRKEGTAVPCDEEVVLLDSSVLDASGCFAPFVWEGEVGLSRVSDPSSSQLDGVSGSTHHPSGQENLAPVAVDDFATTLAGQSVAIPIMSNDSDPDGHHEDLGFFSVEEPSNGAVIALDWGSLQYTPKPDFDGTDWFFYSIWDGVASATALVTIDVLPCESWSALPQISDKDVNCFVIYDDGSGPALFAGRKRDIHRWDGVGWSVFAETNGPVLAMEVFDSGTGPELYVGGNFDQIAGGGSVSNIAVLTDTGWERPGGNEGEVNGEVRALGVYDGGLGACLYVGGSFSEAGGESAHNIARWDGQSWSALANEGLDGAVEDFTVHDDGSGESLYVGGRFHRTEDGEVDLKRIAEWNGQWHPLAEGLGGGDVYALASFDAGFGARLYVGGGFDRDQGSGEELNHVSFWENGAWQPLGDPASPGLDQDVRALGNFPDFHPDKLYIAGDFRNTKAGEDAERIVAWDGQTWLSLDTGLDNEAFALEFFDGGQGAALYVGGRHDQAGSVDVERISRWSCDAP